MNELDSSVPWGRKPVAGIPVPPFRTIEDARTFAIELAVYLAALGDDSPVAPSTFVLLAVLDLDFPQKTGAVQALPSPAALEVALMTYFPAPWTPHGLNDIIPDVFGPDMPYYGDPPGRSHPHSFGWGYDPAFDAVRDRHGHWTVTFFERGSSEIAARLDSDDDMALYRMTFRRGHPLPFGWGFNETRLPELDAAATAAREAWAVHAKLPYLVNWQEKLRAVRGRGGDGGSGRGRQ